MLVGSLRPRPLRTLGATPPVLRLQNYKKSGEKRCFREEKHLPPRNHSAPKACDALRTSAADGLDILTFCKTNRLRIVCFGPKEGPLPTDEARRGLSVLVQNIIEILTFQPAEKSPERAAAKPHRGQNNASARQKQCFSEQKTSVFLLHFLQFTAPEPTI